jgi:hypothetical protein
MMYRSLTQVTSTLMIGLGIAILVVTLWHGGGVDAVGILIGLLFVAAGAGRIWLLRRRR